MIEWTPTLKYSSDRFFAMTDLLLRWAFLVDARIRNAVMLYLQPCCCVNGRMYAMKLPSSRNCQVQCMFSK